MARGTDCETQECNNMQKSVLRAVFCMFVHSWVSQSVPPAIVLHLWGVCFCILVVLQLARLVWDYAYVNIWVLLRGFYLVLLGFY